MLYGVQVLREVFYAIFQHARLLKSAMTVIPARSRDSHERQERRFARGDHNRILKLAGPTKAKRRDYRKLAHTYI